MTSEETWFAESAPGPVECSLVESRVKECNAVEESGKVTLVPKLSTRRASSDTSGLCRLGATAAAAASTGCRDCPGAVRFASFGGVTCPALGVLDRS